ncbi:MAG: hypothetical protein EAZ85_14140 [Bacteroidetes bacterium]|nr:MAG: hypothetical protein EAZ85_14140 [Bacteroidota bacterium]
MKKIIIPLCLMMCILSNCKKKDPCPDLGSIPGIGLCIKIVDKNTGQDMIGRSGKPFHPDSVKTIEFVTERISRPNLGYDGNYSIVPILPFVDTNILLYLNKDDRDTIKIYAGSRKGCANQPPYKIYYKGDLIKETSGNDDIYEAINISIKK